MEELWKPLFGFEEMYEISTFGNVRSKDNLRRGIYNSVRHCKGKLLSPCENNGGYMQVNLRKNGRGKKYLIHRLVALTFIPNPMPLLYNQINHKDEDKHNNHVENLEWCDPLYNNHYGTARARTTEKRSKKVGQYTLSGELVNVWDSTRECGRNGYQQAAISRCCLGTQGTHLGYLWKYI